MAAPVIQEAVKRARVEPPEIDDLIMGAALQQGTQGFNVARQCVVAAGLPAHIAPAGAQFAHFPGECLKPETRWGSESNSNSRATNR
jgi:hypothetical protein